MTVNGVVVTIINERVQYLGADGKIITESLRDYTRKNVRTNYTSLDAFSEILETGRQEARRRRRAGKSRSHLFRSGG